MKQVTICRFLLPAPGDFCVSMLQSQGIDAWLDNANLATMNPFYSVAISGIQLKVPEDQAEAAREILSNPPFPEGELPEAEEAHIAHRLAEDAGHQVIGLRPLHGKRRDIGFLDQHVQPPAMRHRLDPEQKVAVGDGNPPAVLGQLHRDWAVTFRSTTPEP